MGAIRDRRALTQIILMMTLFINCINSQMIFPENKDYAENLQASLVDDISDKYPPGDFVSANAVNPNRNIGGDATNENIQQGLNTFALNLNKALLRETGFGGPKNNIVLSPLSIVGALALLLLGSVGKTYNEISYALGFFNGISESQSVHKEFGSLIDKITKRGEYASFNNDGLINITYGSALFLQQETLIRQQYEDFAKSVYKTSLFHADFRADAPEAQATINKWVSDLTNGKIQQILTSPPPASTRFIMTTTLYFKGMWDTSFMDGLTRRAPFTLDKRNPQQTVDVDLMGTVGSFPFHKSKELECMIVGLPYRGNNTILYAIKPLDATRKSIMQIIQDLNADSLDNLIENARVQKTIVTFPKMKLTSSYNLKDVLKEMGMQSVFSSTEANLALLSPVQGSSAVYMKPKVAEDKSDSDDLFIFTRIGEEDPPKSQNCAHLFEDKKASGLSCTTVETINNQNVTVMYKQIGDKVGRRVIVKRSTRMLRPRRQTAVDSWNPGLYVDEFLHKVDIDITESGTEAAAATAVLISRDGRRPVFAATEPFFFFIRDEDTKFILFSSIVHKPEPNYE